MKKVAAFLLISSVVLNFSVASAEQQCPALINKPLIESSLSRGTEFLLHNQLPAGNFAYEYHWKTKKDSTDDNSVRQAGALWGLSLINHANPSPKVESAYLTGLEFFRQRSVLLPNGSRIVVYGSGKQSLGTVALVALSLVDYLRTDSASRSPKRTELQTELSQYLSFIVSARNDQHLWHQYYDPVTGAPSGPASPYSDGESLLALIKAAKYLGREDLKPIILESASAGLNLNIEQALRLDPDSPTTKGFYQWSSMAFYEISETEWEGREKFRKAVLDLATWMIDVHHTLERPRNTAYAYEGLIHAYALSKKYGDTAQMAKLSCVIEKGLSKLTTLQVGGPNPNPYIKNSQDLSDLRAVGGIQNHASEDGLRIDVTQHQMHALILALKYYL